MIPGFCQIGKPQLGSWLRRDKKFWIERRRARFYLGQKISSMREVLWNTIVTILPQRYIKLKRIFFIVHFKIISTNSQVNERTLSNEYGLLGENNYQASNNKS